MAASTAIGFVGLGNMGRILAANLTGAGFTVVAFDPSGPETCPDGVEWAAGASEVAARAEVVVLSLPDGRVSAEVAAQLASGPDRRVNHVVDTSTIGVTAAESIAAQLSEVGISYVDAPVSGGLAGARARTLFVMYSGDSAACDAVQPVLAGLSDRRRRVGDRAGLAQALKLANNFLSATTLAATSEAVAFGVAVGLEMGTMIDVLNASSGQSAATSDKFTNHVVTGTYRAGFSNSLMDKDVRLYVEEVAARSGPTAFGRLTSEVWHAFAAAEPGADFTRIYPFIESGDQ